MATGVIKAIERFREKGFGFITPHQGWEDIFFHFSGVVGGNEGYNRLREGNVVTYELTTGRDGKTKAINVSVMDKSESGEQGMSPDMRTPAANDDMFAEKKSRWDSLTTQRAANDDDFDQEEIA